MSFLSLLLPQTVLITSSRFNTAIRVVREWGGMKLLVNGSPQSGSYIRMLWSRALRKFHVDALQSVQTILVLGVGGGTVIEILAKRFPRAAITAVDIDPTIIKIAKEYFEIDKHPNVRLVQANANVFVARSARKGTVFDVVVVDLFIGPKIPAFVSGVPFLTFLHKIVKPGGNLLINYLRELEYQERSDAFFVRLKEFWRHVEDLKLYNNRFFLART